MNEINFFVLKGHHILAQGNPGFAGSRPDLEKREQNRPRYNVQKRENPISDERAGHLFSGKMSLSSVRNKKNALFNIFTRTVFLLHPIPRASFLIVPPETLPWANISRPFRP